MDFLSIAMKILFLVLLNNNLPYFPKMVDNIIIACGGILPLLSAATSPTVSTLTPSSGYVL